jgi:murein DD-endopeptidase MepM/ murein hydrolase activator NlpD
VLAVLHAALFLTLQARPGRIAVTLWRWGPPALIAAAAALLATALVAALRHRHTSTYARLVGLGCLCVVVLTMDAYRVFPSSRDSVPSSVEFQLPLTGPVTIAWGGRTATVNRHVNVPSERWGYDLLITLDRATHRGDGTALTDYYAYERAVLAPASGRVIATRDGVADAPPGRPESLNGGGNYVVLEVAPEEYLFVAHLKAGTIRVARGQQVHPGDVLGQVGNSGNSSEPHVHLHLQDALVTDAGEGIPFFFSNYLVVDEERVVARGMPEGGVRDGTYAGQIVRSAVPSPR